MDAYKVVLIIFLILLIIWILGKLFFTTNIVYDIMCDASVLAANLEMDNQSLFSKNKNIVTDFGLNLRMVSNNSVLDNAVLFNKLGSLS